MDIRSIACIAIASIVLSGCAKDDKTYTGSSQVEFATHDVVRQLLFTDNSDMVLDVPLQLIGSRQGKTISVTIKESEGNSAQKETHYLIPSYTLSIPSDSLSVTLPITLKPQNFKEGESVTLGIELSSSDVKIAENYKKCVILLKKQSFLDVFTGKYICEEPTSQSTYATTFVKGDADNTIKNRNFWNFPQEGETVTYLIAKDTSRKVTIVEQDWTDKLGITYKVSGSGKYETNGKMDVNYTMRIKTSSVDSIYEIGVHHFTPANLSN